MGVLVEGSGHDENRIHAHPVTHSVTRRHIVVANVDAHGPGVVRECLVSRRVLSCCHVSSDDGTAPSKRRPPMATRSRRVAYKCASSSSQSLDCRNRWMFCTVCAPEATRVQRVVVIASASSSSRGCHPEGARSGRKDSKVCNNKNTKNCFLKNRPGPCRTQHFKNISKLGPTDPTGPWVDSAGPNSIPISRHRSDFPEPSVTSRAPVGLRQHYKCCM